MKNRFIALLLACFVLLGALAGCSKQEYVATVDGVEIPVGYYTINMMFYRVQYENYYGDDYAAQMSAPSAEDPDRTNADVSNAAMKSAFEQLLAYKVIAERLGLEVDELTEVTFAGEYEYYQRLFNTQGDWQIFLKKAGLTEEEHRELYEIQACYPDLIYNYYFDPDVGVNKYSESDIREYYLSLTDYAAKHILFAYATPPDDGSDYDEAVYRQYRQDALDEAEKTLAELKSGTADFDDAMNELSDDTSLAYYPDGYGFTADDGVLPDVFIEAMDKLEIGEYDLFESDYGFHIIKRIDLDDFFADQKATYEAAFTTEFLSDLYKEAIAGMEIEYNDAVLAKYDFGTAKRTNVTLSPEAFE